jgi:hypothetical protein
LSSDRDFFWFGAPWVWCASDPGDQTSRTIPVIMTGRKCFRRFDLRVMGFRARPGAGGTIQDQTRQALANCEAILQAGGASLDDVIEVGILLTNPADFAGLNEEYARWFPSGPPTRYVAKLGVDLAGLLVSIRMTAFII